MEDLSRDDLLLHRAVDGSATATEWAELAGLAQRAPQLWNRLVEAHGDQRALEEALDGELAALDGGELDVARAGRPASAAPPRRWAWAGWAAAAAALFWVGLLSRPGQGTTPVETRGAGTQLTSSDTALDAYRRLGREEGRVVEELPVLLIESREVPGSSDTVEVVYVRRLVERAVVDSFYELHPDEFGRAVPQPVGPPPSPSGVVLPY